MLILVPSLKLAGETMIRIKTFHLEKLGIKHFQYYEVHSDGGSFDINTMNKDKYVCVVGVYNSVIKLHDASMFDIIIFDEAHRTSIKSRGHDNVIESEDNNETHFTYALSDNNILSRYRLFMTATPRLISNDENSMSNCDKYGDVIYSMTIREAVKKHIINDYKVWMYVKTHNEQLSIENDDERFALLMKFIEQCNGIKTLIVCRSIKTCELVSSSLIQRGFNNVYSVHSQMNKKEGNEAINSFKTTTQKSCLCAVNMFKEGIDCPAIDSVVFYDERSSVIDVLQIVGRGLRYKHNVDFTDIGILCSVNPSERLDNQSEMRYLRMIIQNMFDYNEELTNNLHIVKPLNDKIEQFDDMIKQVRNEMKDNEDTSSFEDIITLRSDVNDFGEKHYQQSREYAQERTAFFNWRIKEDWFDYISRADLPRDIPRRPDRVYKTMGWISWDDFLGLDPEKPLDLATYKYILQKNKINNNPTEEEYTYLVNMYGKNKVILPHECKKIYNKSFYDIIHSCCDKANFISMFELKQLKNKYSDDGVFSMVEYNNMKNIEYLVNRLPHYPFVYYNISSFNKF
jgi:superfamily II DNA or RNA helicase